MLKDWVNKSKDSSVSLKTDLSPPEAMKPQSSQLAGVPLGLNVLAPGALVRFRIGPTPSLLVSPPANNRLIFSDGSQRTVSYTHLTLPTKA